VALTPSSSQASAPGGAYYLYGGLILSTTLTPSSTGILGAYALSSASAAHYGDVVTGTVSIDSFDAFILFDSGATFSFVSKAFVDRMGISIQQIGHPITVNSAKGPISSNYVCSGCVVRLADKDFVANLVVIPLDVFDAILGMD
jgi:predicted aspartyl protease